MVLMVVLIGASVLFGTEATRNNAGYDEGYYTGFLSDCPGSEKPSIISRESLQHLSILALGAKSSPNAKRKKYTYYQMRELANDPTMDFSKKTMLYVGGFLDFPTFILAKLLESTYKRLGYNVWLMDTNRFVTVSYPIASRLIRTAGRHAGEMLHNITRHNSNFDPKKLEIVGLSLGSQTMSYMAKTYTALTGMKIAKLTGLDPAGPCFRNLGPDQRLDKTDADYVEIVATNIDGFGIAAPIGHVNFYINGGEYQHGDLVWSFCDMLCSHLKVFIFWYSALESPNSFIAMQCDSIQQARDRDCYDRKPLVTNLLGLNVDKSKEGIFYLPATYYYPYHMGEKGLQRKYDPYFTVLEEMNADPVMVV
ncbi:lipase member H-A-like [Achroia grisella]|uniref:lipase member H-A-like n=1 Tax=Achroia grisella TaxID=688607 RepID=UPI0027D25563|nr:lipase member H-A-like [Achroia grisella]